MTTQNWFSECTKSVLKKKLNAAGPIKLPHSWAYLPDAVIACEQVLTQRLSDTMQPNHMVVPFAGHVFSFSQLRSALESITGGQIKVSAIPWQMIRVMGWVMPGMRDLFSMRYLWNHDIRLDNSALTKLLGGVPHHTPFEQAVQKSIPGLS